MQFLLLILMVIFSIPLSSHQNPSFSKQEELTDAIFPRTKPEIIGKIYQMLKVIDKVFTKHNIPYWIDGGTALGALRHQGCIPWDDDADLVFHIEDHKRILALRIEFLSYGFYLAQDEILRLYPSPQEKHPYIDLMEYTLYDDIYRYDLKKAPPHFYDKFYWLSEEVNTLVRVPFGPIMLNAANDLTRYVFTGYGTDCMTHAVFQTPHGGEGGTIRINEKVRIVDFDSADYIIVNPRIPLDP